MAIETALKTCVVEQGKSWKTLPVAVGKSAPKNFESLISFEELQDYTLVSIYNIKAGGGPGSKMQAAPIG